MQKKVIILRVLEHGDNNLILKALSEDGALLSFFGRSAKKSKKRFAPGILAPTHFLKVSYQESRNGGLDSLQEAILLYDFSGLRTDYEKLSMALHFLKLTTKVVREDTIDNSKVFDLLGNALKALESSENLTSINYQFVLKLLSQQGVLPPELQSSVHLKHTLAEHGKISQSASQDLAFSVKALSMEYLGLPPYGAL